MFRCPECGIEFALAKAAKNCVRCQPKAAVIDDEQARKRAVAKADGRPLVVGDGSR